MENTISPRCQEAEGALMLKNAEILRLSNDVNLLTAEKVALAAKVRSLELKLKEGK